MTPRQQHRGDGRNGIADGFPAEPGWWIQWVDGPRWFPVTAEFAAWVEDMLVEGDVLVEVKENDNNHPGEIANA